MRRRITELLALLCAGVLVACGMAEGSTPDGSATSSPVALLTPTPTRTPVPSDFVAPTRLPAPVAVSALARIRQSGELRVGVLYNYPPFGYLADNGQVHGYEVELVRKIAERWGVGVTFIQVTRQTRLPVLYSGEVDMLAAAVPHRRDLEQFLEFSDTTFRGGYMVLVRAGSSTDIITALAGGPVAAVGPDAQQAALERVQQVGAAPVIQVFATTADAVTALLSGTVNAVVDRRENLILLARDADVQLLEGFVQEEPYAFAFQRGDTPLRDLVNLTLQDIIAAGEIGPIFSASFYGQPTDLFSVRPGEPLFTFENFPADITPTESAVERIRRGEPLRVAGLDLSTQPAPYSGQPIVDGFNRAVINEIARRWNVPIVEIPASAGQAGLNLLMSGQADLAVGIRPDRSLLGQVALSQPYYTRGLRVIHMSDVTVLNVSDLEFKPSLVVEPVDASEDLIRRNNDFPRVEVAASPEEAFQALVARGVYAVVGDEFTLMLMARADARLAFAGGRYRPRDYSMATSRFDPDFLALLNFTLQDMAADGTLDALHQQYFSPYLPEGETVQPMSLEVWPGDGGYLGVGG